MLNVAGMNDIKAAVAMDNGLPLRRARLLGWPAGRHATPFCGCGASTLSSEFLNELREWLSDAKLPQSVKPQCQRTLPVSPAYKLPGNTRLRCALRLTKTKEMRKLFRPPSIGSRMQLPYPFLKIPASLIVLPSNVR